MFSFQKEKPEAKKLDRDLSCHSERKDNRYGNAARLNSGDIQVRYNIDKPMDLRPDSYSSPVGNHQTQLRDQVKVSPTHAMSSAIPPIQGVFEQLGGPSELFSTHEATVSSSAEEKPSIGSVYFPTGRLRLLHEAGPSASFVRPKRSVHRLVSNMDNHSELNELLKECLVGRQVVKDILSQETDDGSGGKMKVLEEMKLPGEKRHLVELFASETGELVDYHISRGSPADKNELLNKSGDDKELYDNVVLSELTADLIANPTFSLASGGLTLELFTEEIRRAYSNRPENKDAGEENVALEFKRLEALLPQYLKLVTAYQGSDNATYRQNAQADIAKSTDKQEMHAALSKGAIGNWILLNSKALDKLPVDTELVEKYMKPIESAPTPEDSGGETPPAPTLRRRIAIGGGMASAGGTGGYTGLEFLQEKSSTVEAADTKVADAKSDTSTEKKE